MFPSLFLSVLHLTLLGCPPVSYRGNFISPQRCSKEPRLCCPSTSSSCSSVISEVCSHRTSVFHQSTLFSSTLQQVQGTRGGGLCWGAPRPTALLGFEPTTRSYEMNLLWASSCLKAFQMMQSDFQLIYRVKPPPYYRCRDSVIFSFTYDEKYSELSQSEAGVMWIGSRSQETRRPFPGKGKLEQPSEAGGYVGRLLLIHAALTYTNKRGNRRDDSRGEHSRLLKTDRGEASPTSVEQRKTATQTHGCVERSNNVFFCGLLGAGCACSGRLSSLKKSV